MEKFSKMSIHKFFLPENFRIWYNSSRNVHLCIYLHLYNIHVYMFNVDDIHVQVYVHT